MKNRPVIKEIEEEEPMRRKFTPVVQGNSSGPSQVSQEEVLHVLSETIPHPAYLTDCNGRFISTNSSFDRFVGIKREFLIGKSFHDIAPRELADAYVALDEALLLSAGAQAYQTRFRHADRSVRDVVFHRSVIRNESGDPAGIAGIIIDFTNQRVLQEALEETRNLLDLHRGGLERRNREVKILQELSDLLQTCVSVDEARFVVPSSAEKLFPGSSGSIALLRTSRNLAETIAAWGGEQHGEDIFAPEDCWALRRGKLHLVDEGKHAVVCQHLGEKAPGRYVCVPLVAQGETIGIVHVRFGKKSVGVTDPEGFEGMVERLVVTMAGQIALAITNLTLRVSLKNQVIRDPLTGLFNRRYLEETLTREASRCDRSGGTTGIVMIDVDHFKRINDHFGHGVGDNALKEIGVFLKSKVRAEDIPCRFGGEEFALVLPGASLEDTLLKAEKIREGAKGIVVLNNGQRMPAMTFSLGVACYPTHGKTPHEVVEAADTALYRAKNSGRNRVVSAGQTDENPGQGTLFEAHGAEEG